MSWWRAATWSLAVWSRRVWWGGAQGGSGLDEQTPNGPGGEPALGGQGGDRRSGFIAGAQFPGEIAPGGHLVRSAQLAGLLWGAHDGSRRVQPVDDGAVPQPRGGCELVDRGPRFVAGTQDLRLLEQEGGAGWGRAGSCDGFPFADGLGVGGDQFVVGALVG
jgi:hypothetical protein